VRRKKERFFNWGTVLPDNGICESFDGFIDEEAEIIQ